MQSATQIQPRCRKLMGVRVVATGGYVPPGVVTNERLAEQVGCTPAWITGRTGIVERRYAGPSQSTADLCVEACRSCLDGAGSSTADIDLLILATCTPETLMPATGCSVQHRLGLTCPVVDLHGACAGFVFALVTGATYIASGASDLVLVVSGDCLSRGCDPADGKTAPLFGDGAGAVLLGRAGAETGLVSYALGTDGTRERLIHRPQAAGNSFMSMDGPAVFRWAVSILSGTSRAVLESAELSVGDVSLFISHQANLRIIHAAAEVLGVPPERFFTNLQRYGNTSAGSVPLALHEAVSDGRVRQGDLIVLSGFGSGLCWGTIAFRW